jgi:hypothetical protein
MLRAECSMLNAECLKLDVDAHAQLPLATFC